ncbi:hypothetical protein AVEN_3313-1 [Araneus ventricosus]|uniref:Uncharacterized protein n=1 Tax=Araneus ventricosus TaxID=182803 RepID=A0A4Y2PNJ2_ARAVE|nr:hypothetical protein AVEN_3313-1 [Araneus ventricosus]
MSSTGLYLDIWIAIPSGEYTDFQKISDQMSFVRMRVVFHRNETKAIWTSDDNRARRSHSYSTHQSLFQRRGDLCVCPAEFPTRPDHSGIFVG